MIVRRVLSFTVGILTPSADLFEELCQLTASLPSLPEKAPLPLTYTIEPAEAGYCIRRNGALAGERLPREQLFAAIQGDLAVHLAQSRNFGLLHAAALARGRKVVLLPGASGSGKTTLSAALLKRGFGYLSDEFAPLSFHSLTVKPYPFPLRLRESALRLLPPLAPELTLWPTPFWAKGEQVFYGLPASRLLLSEGEWPIGLIVFPQLRPGGGTEVRKLKPGIAALKLMALTINSEALGEAGFTMAANLVQKIPCYDLLMEEIEEAVRLIDTLWEKP